MKILIIDTHTEEGGHFIEYIRNILIADNEYILLLGKMQGEFDYKQYIFKSAKKGEILLKKRRESTNPIKKIFFKVFSVFVNMLNSIKLINFTMKIIKIENPDICHFLNGDIIYSVALGKLKKYNTIITMHGIRNRIHHNLIMNRKIIFKNITMGVVHTSVMIDKLEEENIFNVTHIEYPCFEGKSDLNKAQAKRYWKLPLNVPVISVLGQTRYEKGLDILLSALRSINAPFFLFVAGDKADFGETYINQAIEKYRDNVKICLRILTEEEFKNAVMAADFIVVPYRKGFQGASGPLTYGVVAKKVIIGSSFGSIGKLIKENHLGYTFETEVIDDLTTVLNHALTNTFHYDEVAEKYVEQLNPERFRREHQDLYNRVLEML
jgi:glycosyltransferase involved in cell wall biosynthesis